MAGTCQYKNQRGVHKGKGATAMKKATAVANSARSKNLRQVCLVIYSNRNASIGFRLAAREAG